MGRTLPSIAMVFMHDEGSLQSFRRSLRRVDQLALDELLDEASKHLAEAAYAGSSTPFEIFLLSMLLEEHKELIRVREKVKAALPPPVD